MRDPFYKDFNGVLEVTRKLIRGGKFNSFVTNHRSIRKKSFIIKDIVVEINTYVPRGKGK